MNKTVRHNMGLEGLAVSCETLAGLLDCGHATARQIGKEAGARFQIGSRVLYRTDKIREYLDTLSCS